MIDLFVTSLFLTFLITRGLTYILHDIENYGTRNERSKTPTGLLRRKTGYDWHHFHFGIIILIITIPIISFIGFNKTNLVALSIGISLVIAQMNCKPGDYFRFKNFIKAFIFHIFMAAFAIIIYSLFFS